MAMYGTARFTWTDTVLKIHTLNVPLQRVRPAFRIRRWVRESLDYSTREVWYAGSGVHEIVAEVRYDEFPQSLIELLLAGAKGITITYYDGVEEYDCDLIAPAGSVVVDFDEYQMSEDWHRLEIRLRRTDGSAFGASVFEPDLLFQIMAGHLHPASYTMTTSGNASHLYTDKLGVLQATGAVDLVRVNWEWSDDRTPYPDLPSIMLESPAATNFTDTDDLTAWDTTGTPVITSNVDDPSGGTGAYTVEDADGGAYEYISDVIAGLSGAGVRSFTFVVRENSHPAGGYSYYQIGDSGSGTVAQLQITAWTDGEPTINAVTGVYLGKRRLTDGWWIIYGQTDSFTPGATVTQYIVPAWPDTTDTGSIDVWRAMVYDDPVPLFSPVPTVDKNSEVLYYPYAHPPQEMCGVVDFRELEDPDWTLEGGLTQRIMTIGDASNNAPRFFVYRGNGTDEYRILHDNGIETPVTSAVDINPSWGDRVQLFWWLFADGSVRIAGRNQALGSTSWSALSYGTQSSGIGFLGAFSAERLYLGSVGADGQARQLYYGLGLYRGSGASARSLAARIGFGV